MNIIMKKINIIKTICINSVVTCPSLIYHTLSNKCRSLASIKSTREQLIE